MSAQSGLGYAQARLQARYAQLPREDDWQRLVGARTLGGFLEEAREGALRSWVKGFSALSDAHDLDRGLRAIWREGISEVAHWMPAPWRSAVAWLDWLTLLPLLAHVKRFKSLPAWVDLDTDLRLLHAAEGGLDLQAMDAAGAAALMVSPGELAAAWQARWQQLWPSCSKGPRRRLEQLSGLVLAHARVFGQSESEIAWALRRELRERLRLGFHRMPLEPAVAFAFLGLMALDLERLRAALMERALFGQYEAA
jgi:hypothetical protein